MKRWISVLIVFILLLTGCSDNTKTPPAVPTQEPSQGLTQPSTQDTPSEPSPELTQPPSQDIQPEPSPDYSIESESLAALRKSAADSGALLAVAFLGYSELPNFGDVSIYLEANRFTEVHPFLNTIPEDRLVRQAGGELYAVVPVSNDVKLTVSQYLLDDHDDYIPDVGEELLSVSGDPILLIGNVSEIVPNLFISAEGADGRIVEFAPCLSMENGLLTVCEGVYDFSPTELFSQYWPDYELPDAIVCGKWYAQHYLGEELMAMTLQLDENGRAEYFYGYPNGDVLEMFEGTWSIVDGDQIVLDLFGGPVSWEGSDTAGESYPLQSTFDWNINSSALILQHADGPGLLYDTEGETYKFLPFDGFRFIGDWLAESSYWGWTYELRLFDNGSTWFGIYDRSGEILVMYEGWWSAENDIMNLSLVLSYGQHPETEELDYIQGSYFAQMSSPDALTLEFMEGYILTVNMEGSTLEQFTRRGA